MVELARFMDPEIDLGIEHVVKELVLEGRNFNIEYMPRRIGDNFDQILVGVGTRIINDQVEKFTIMVLGSPTQRYVPTYIRRIVGETRLEREQRKYSKEQLENFCQEYGVLFEAQADLKSTLGLVKQKFSRKSKK